MNTPNLDKVFGPKPEPTDPVNLDDLRRPTHFPRAEAAIQLALDEFLEAVRREREDPEYIPDIATRQKWVNQTRKSLLGRKGGYRKGFYTWAVPEHFRSFREQGKRTYLVGPMSVDYLWDSYIRQEKTMADIGVYCLECKTWHPEGEHYERE